ncbi:hypothetical protein ACS0TY_012369 [Phlomoides rotata]
MGNQKLRWKEEEEEALKAGVAKHGTGKWKNILADPEFNHKLILRSNVDLKDKWRNLCVTVEQGSGANRTPNGQARTSSVFPPRTENSSSVVTKDNVNDKHSSSSRRAKNGPPTAKPRPKPRLCFTAKEVEDAAKTIAKHVADAENKSFIAAEAITESEQIAQLAEDSDEMVMHLKEIFEQLEKTKQTSSSSDLGVRI